jgi:signal transduction histidine kinase/HAMP domain-containing protein
MDARPTYEELEQRVKALEQRTAEPKGSEKERIHLQRQLESLQKIAHMVDADYRTLCDQVLSEILDMTQSQYAFYGFLDEDETVMTLYSWSREVLAECSVVDKPIHYPIAKAGVWADAVRKRRALIINDYQANHSGKTGIPEGHVQLTRILSVPIFSHGKIVALAAVSNKQSDYVDDDAKQIEALVASGQVILDLRQAQEALQESEEKFRGMNKELAQGLSEVLEALKQLASGDPEVRIPETAKLELITRLKQMVNLTAQDLGEIVHLSHEFAMGLAEHFDALHKVSKGDLNARVTGTSQVELLEQLKKVTNQMIESVSTQIAERQRAEEALRKSEEELRHLSSQLLKVQENERKRISRELHDSIGQSLTAIKFGLENARSQVAQDTAEASVELLATLIPLVQQASEEVRRIHTDLRPSMLDDLGILTTINWLCREFQLIYTGIRIEKQVDIKENDVPESLKIIIFRILQEALNNVAKHSHADLVRLHFGKTRNTIRLAIRDNGRGFDMRGVLTTEVAEKGFGITSMKERAELSEGVFAIKSALGAGTVVDASWPYKGGQPVS